MHLPQNSSQNSLFEWLVSWSFYSLGVALEPPTYMLVELNTWNDLIFRILQNTAFTISITAGILTIRKQLKDKTFKNYFKRKKK